MSRIASSPRETVLIFRLGSIGDTVVALPCFHGIAQRFPSHRRILLTNALVSARTSSAESILNGTGLVDEVIYYPVGRFSLTRTLQLLVKVRALRPSCLVYLAERPHASSVYRDMLFFKAAGIPKMIGLPLSRRFRRCAVDPETRELEYEVERLARNLNSEVPVTLSPAGWNLMPLESERSKVDRVLGLVRGGSILALAPGAKIECKDWGPDNWTSLVKTLASTAIDTTLVLVGGSAERDLCARIGAHWTGTVLNLCGILSPRETAVALGRCHILVCHDSGPMHLAASQQTPCVALFGNYNLPHKWYPYGQGHCVIHDPTGVRAIRVDRVAAAVRQMLQRQHAA